MRSTARFEARRPATRRQEAAIVVTGPLLWLLAILLVAVVVDRLDVVELAILVTAGSFVAALAVLTLARRRRLIEERDARR